MHDVPIGCRRAASSDPLNPSGVAGDDEPEILGRWRLARANSPTTIYRVAEEVRWSPDSSTYHEIRCEHESVKTEPRRRLERRGERYAVYPLRLEAGGDDFVTA